MATNPIFERMQRAQPTQQPDNPILARMRQAQPPQQATPDSMGQLIGPEAQPYQYGPAGARALATGAAMRPFGGLNPIGGVSALSSAALASGKYLADPLGRATTSYVENPLRRLLGMEEVDYDVREQESLASDPIRRGAKQTLEFLASLPVIIGEQVGSLFGDSAPPTTFGERTYERALQLAAGGARGLKDIPKAAGVATAGQIGREIGGTPGEIIGELGAGYFTTLKQPTPIERQRSIAGIRHRAGLPTDPGTPFNTKQAAETISKDVLGNRRYRALEIGKSFDQVERQLKAAGDMMVPTKTLNQFTEKYAALRNLIGQTPDFAFQQFLSSPLDAKSGMTISQALKPLEFALQRGGQISKVSAMDLYNLQRALQRVVNRIPTTVGDERLLLRNLVRDIDNIFRKQRGPSLSGVMPTLRQAKKDWAELSRDFIDNPSLGGFFAVNADPEKALRSVSTQTGAEHLHKVVGPQGRKAFRDFALDEITQGTPDEGLDKLGKDSWYRAALGKDAPGLTSQMRDASKRAADVAQGVELIDRYLGAKGARYAIGIATGGYGSPAYEGLLQSLKNAVPGIVDTDAKRLADALTDPGVVQAIIGRSQ